MSFQSYAKVYLKGDPEPIYGFPNMVLPQSLWTGGHLGIFPSPKAVADEIKEGYISSFFLYISSFLLHISSFSFMNISFIFLHFSFIGTYSFILLHNVLHNSSDFLLNSVYFLLIKIFLNPFDREGEALCTLKFSDYSRGSRFYGQFPECDVIRGVWAGLAYSEIFDLPPGLRILFQGSQKTWNVSKKSTRN